MDFTVWFAGNNLPSLRLEKRQNISALIEVIPRSERAVLLSFMFVVFANIFLGTKERVERSCTCQQNLAFFRRDNGNVTKSTTDETICATSGVAISRRSDRDDVAPFAP